VNVSNKSLTKFTNYTFLFFSVALFLFYILNNLKSNIYEVLFIDERMLIDDIYNVWLLEDLYNRFSSISNQTIKNILIIFIELAYGGDLRYGRLWSNVFTILVGPTIFISDTVVIIFSRILNSLLFFTGAYYLSRNLVDKKYLWISVFTIYSLPAVEYFHRIPKPDTLLILFVAISLKYLTDQRYYHSIFFLAIASFIKVNTFIIFFFIWIYIFFKSNEDKVRLVLKTFFLSMFSLFIVNPILLIPPLSFGGIQLPNFYKIYFNWLTTQSSNGDEIVFSFLNFTAWLETLSDFYNFPNKYLFALIFSIIITFIFKAILQSSDDLSKYLLFIFCFYIFFYFFFIERQYTHYLHLPFSLLLIAFWRTFKKSNNLPAIILVLIVGTTGNFTNINKFLSDTTFNANTRYGYTSVATVNDAEILITKIIKEIKLVYKANPSLDKNLVYWHPDLFTPRNRVTYNDTFFVREYWGNKDSVESAIKEADIYVTYTNYQVSDSITKLKVENFYLYYFKNLNN